MVVIIGGSENCFPFDQFKGASTSVCRRCNKKLEQKPTGYVIKMQHKYLAKHNTYQQTCSLILTLLIVYIYPDVCSAHKIVYHR